MSDRTNFPLVFVLWGAGLGAAGQYAKISVIFDQLGPVYPEAGAALGFIVSLVGFVGILLGVVAGLVVARIRYRRAMLWALWAGAGVSLFQALLPALPAERRARCLDLLAATRAPLPRALRRKCKEYARRERDRRDPPGEPAPVARGADGDDASGAAKERKLDAAKEKETPETLKAQLEDLLCEECPFCGEASIALIDAPFVGPDEAEEAESWRTPRES